MNWKERYRWHGAKDVEVKFEHYRVPENTSYMQKKGAPNYMALAAYSRGDGFVNDHLSEVKPYPRGGLTICTVEKGGVGGTGDATCSMSDSFCYRVGRAIAFGRAILNLAEWVRWKKDRKI